MAQTESRPTQTWDPQTNKNNTSIILQWASNPDNGTYKLTMMKIHTWIILQEAKKGNGGVKRRIVDSRQVHAGIQVKQMHAYGFIFSIPTQIQNRKNTSTHQKGPTDSGFYLNTSRL